MLSGKPSVSRLDRARPLVACKSKGRKKVSAGVEPIYNSITFMSCYSLTRIMLSHYSECTAVAPPKNCILNPNLEMAVRFKLRQDI